MTEENTAGTKLKDFIERIERLEEEKTALTEDIKEVYNEVKGFGFEVKVVRRIVQLRKINSDKRKELEEIEELYKAAIGMV